ncbi:MAG TPA: glutaredoxin domain-containing protein [Polyangiaceae bacterium LLY-WYZ-15_(1-7)]|nr:hypothetical protein [Sandaracinus sp.]HJL04303.1 glutaredoxin domain-containing protein [Polyangiaceae bacterium LLY-WYZ-15_(1-7)]HJL10522.1 glutaredoxin domain-containing protein [Polyangiaceae bacterium LLY-WYZ-15_(1-7)]HJL23749.1 glutaredoxin domain-containing protein [Polyangiaceae bacterium LLY-WYZ-15_(1-7)]HJL28596.1 glutaredoxin domain-containing protein [Polyangiaceae bacterium LLY-WYZ-15_(1-7)]
MRRLTVALLLLLAASALGCESGARSAAAPGEAAEGAAGEVVDPPFAVRGDASGLVLTWYDEEGAHVAESRDEIPAERRERVRVDSLELPPEQRDPSAVYVADLRQPGEGGAYVVRRYGRAAFDALLDEATGADQPEALADASVVVYGASWCNACQAAKRWFEREGVGYVERDIERDPGAREEMQRKAREAGIMPSGIPVIDVRGRLVTGFDPNTLRRLLDETEPRTL